MNPAPFTRWRTSSYSTGNPDNCVEVGEAPEQRAVRDTKLGEASPQLVFSLGNWNSFTAKTKIGSYESSPGPSGEVAAV